jgi:hypothetical protein
LVALGRVRLQLDQTATCPVEFDPRGAACPGLGHSAADQIGDAAFQVISQLRVQLVFELSASDHATPPCHTLPPPILGHQGPG